MVYTASVTAPVTGSPVVVTLSNGQTITIPVGESSASVNFTAPNDALAGGSSLSTTITKADGGNYEKLEVSDKPAETSVTDTPDTTTLSLSATESVAEGGSIVYTATLTNAAGTPVTVTLSNGAVITIAAGATSGTATVAAPADDVSTKTLVKSKPPSLKPKAVTSRTWRPIQHQRSPTLPIPSTSVLFP